MIFRKYNSVVEAVSFGALDMIPGINIIVLTTYVGFKLLCVFVL